MFGSNLGRGIGGGNTLASRFGFGEQTTPATGGFDYNSYVRNPAFAAQEAAQPQAPPRRGMFGGGAPTRTQAIAGVIGDALLQASGGQGMFIPMALQQRQQAMEAERAQAQTLAQRDAQMQQWIAQQEWKRANPELTSFQQDLIAGGVDPFSHSGRSLALGYAQGRGDPYTVLSLSGGRVYAGPRSGLGIALGAPQSAGATSLPPPQVGDVQEGHRFLGGEAGDPRNWVPVERAATGEEAGAVMATAMNTKILSQADWQRIQAALGPQGQGAAEAWLRANNIRVGAQ